MYRNQSVSSHQFSMVPRAEVPRARFNMSFNHKTTFDAGWLIPIMCEEVLPGDFFSVRLTAFARLATPIYPLMDNLYLDTFFFYVPNRLVWSNFVRMMGEQDTPTSSISYIVPTITSPAGGYPVGSVFDYFGLPTVGQVSPSNWITHSALPLRAYTLIWNTWFRDENLQNPFQVPLMDGPDDPAYVLFRRAKRPDYFTTALPWPEKGGTPVMLPLGDSAPVVSNYQQPTFKTSASGSSEFGLHAGTVNLTDPVFFWNGGNTGVEGSAYFGSRSGLVADLSEATAVTINQLRQAFQIQRLLERDARGGTRYTELVASHFGVRSPDARLDRPEYLGGGSTPIVLTPIAQNSATDIQGSATPLGNLAAMGTVVGRNGFSSSFVEHGYVIGLAQVRADTNYQQGLRRHWKRSTRYDFYFPVFAMLGEQAILGQELYADGTSGDDSVFGYAERWGEYRYIPSMITGLFRSTSAGTLDAWHLAQRFNTRPVLNEAFLVENPPLERVLAVGSAAGGAQIIFDSRFDIKATRPLPLFSVPGMIDHF